MVPSSQPAEVIETGVIEHGAIALDHPLAIPDGVKVKVYVQEIGSMAAAETQLGDADFRSLSFFGEWAGRTDLRASEDYIREERAKWSQRLAREG